MKVPSSKLQVPKKDLAVGQQTSNFKLQRDSRFELLGLREQGEKAWSSGRLGRWGGA